MWFNQKFKGSISVFLAIILFFTIVLTGVLIDGSRIRSGDAQVQAAVDSAAQSTLANYNNTLKNLYGLFALSENNPDNLKEEFENYLNKTLMTELGVGKKSMGDKFYDYLNGMIAGDGKYKDVNFLDLYDFNVEDAKITPVYNLTENEVMKNQMIEYMKYRAPKQLAEGFLEKVMSFKDFGKQSEVMKEKITLDKGLNKIRKNQEKLTN